MSVTTNAPATPEQIKAGTEMHIGLQAALLPAKLKNLRANGIYIVNEIIKRKLSLSVDSAVSVVKAILYENKLEWEVEPAALKAKKANDNPATKTSVQASLNQQEQKRRDGEKADAYATQQADYEQSALELVSSFLPMTKRGQVDNRNREEVQANLKAHIAKEKARGCSMKAVHAIVADEIQKHYAAIERANERL